jgi:hypothetical protein
VAPPVPDLLGMAAKPAFIVKTRTEASIADMLAYTPPTNGAIKIGNHEITQRPFHYEHYSHERTSKK